MRFHSVFIASLCSCILFTAFVSTPASALECDNVGTAWTTQPDDTGDGLATACGDGAVADGVESTALGKGATSGGSYGTAVGRHSDASGENSVALGRFAVATGNSSTSLGQSSASPGVASTALGRRAIANSDMSTALGFRAFTEQANSIVLGSIPDVNLATVYADVAIGTTTPDAPLHVHRNNGTAHILVEETNLTRSRREMIHMKNNGPVELLFDDELYTNDWVARAQGLNFRIYRQNAYSERMDINKNGNVSIGGVLSENSDRNAKTAIEHIDPNAVLEKVAALPISQWQYKDALGVDHIGPMAQDFHAAFGVGASDTSISTLDTSGVALAAIQALEEENNVLEDENAQLRSQNLSLEQRVHAQEDRLERLETLVMQMASDKADKIAAH